MTPRLSFGSVVLGAPLDAVGATLGVIPIDEMSDSPHSPQIDAGDCQGFPVALTLRKELPDDV